MSEVVAFLDGLSCGEKSTPGTRENLAEWNKNIEVNRGWYSSRREAKAQPPDGSAAAGDSEGREE